MKSSKSLLRKNFLLKRKNKYFSEKKFNFNLVFNLIKKHFNKKKITIAGYYPTDFEVNILNFLENSLKKKFTISLPVIKSSKSMCFKKWTYKEPLAVNKFGIPEPIKTNKEIIDISEQQITDDYASKLNQKIVDNIDKRVMTVSGKDIKTYSHLQQIIRVNLKSYYDELLENRKLKQHQKKKYVKPNQTECDYALEVYNTLEGKDKKRFNQYIQRQIQEQKSHKRQLRRNKKKDQRNV